MGYGPLDGFRVVDVCRAGVGHWATGILADYGASVVSVVEPGYAERMWPGAAGPRVHRRNSRSIFLNLRLAEARDVFTRLARNAHAVLESNRPGVAARLGIDYYAIQRVNSSVVYCSLSGFGQTGPYSTVPAHDLSFQGVSGVLPLDRQGRPMMPANWVADWHAAHYAAMAVLMGLLHRATTGQGQYIDLSFADATLKIDEAYRDDEMLRGTYPCYNIYETADHRYLTLSIQEPWFWERLCRFVRREEWAAHLRPERALRDEIFGFLRTLFATRELAEWTAALAAEGIPSGPVNTTADQLATDPQLRAREMVVDLTGTTTAESSYTAGLAMKFSRTPGRLSLRPTALGAETDQILSELGYGSDVIERLRSSGAIG